MLIVVFGVWEDLITHYTGGKVVWPRAPRPKSLWIAPEHESTKHQNCSFNSTYTIQLDQWGRSTIISTNWLFHCVYAGHLTIEGTHESISTDSSSFTIRGELAKIVYAGNKPIHFHEFLIFSACWIHVEQHTDLKNAGKPVGWFQLWRMASCTDFRTPALWKLADGLAQEMTGYDVMFHSNDGRANT